MPMAVGGGAAIVSGDHVYSVLGGAADESTTGLGVVFHLPSGLAAAEVPCPTYEFEEIASAAVKDAKSKGKGVN